MTETAQPGAAVCNFCLKRAEIVARKNDVAMCTTCMIDAIFTHGKRDPVWWGVLLAGLASHCAPSEGDSIVENVTRAAMPFLVAHVGLVRSTAESFALRDTVPFWRSVVLLLDSIHPAYLTADDARRAIYAALFVGELERAARIEPARFDQRADRYLKCHQHVVALLGMAAGSPEARTRRDAVIAQGEVAPAASVGERFIVAATEAFAHVRAGDAAAGLARYAPYREDPMLRPWHAIAIGDALLATGDEAGAHAIWRRIADHATWEPYWPSRARERLNVATPYR